jgi:hypothetical protein
MLDKGMQSILKFGHPPLPPFKSGGTMFSPRLTFLANNLETAEIRAGKQKFYVDH